MLLYEGIKVIGIRWSPDLYGSKTLSSEKWYTSVAVWFLLSLRLARERNLVVFRHLRVWNINHNQPKNDTDNTASLINITYINTVAFLKLPLVIFPDGTYMDEPSNSGLAEKIGLKTQAQMPFYDLIIIGAGPAGL